LKIAAHAKDYVFRLHLHQFLGRGDIAWLFDSLHLLHSVSVTYGAREVGMQYDRTAFGMKLLDCEMMAKSLSSSQSLTSLHLHENLLDDEKIRRLSAGLKANNTLTDLDLSHNMISDRGVRSLCKFLTENVILTSLNLCDNRVYADGAKYIGRGYIQLTGRGNYTKYGQLTGHNLVNNPSLLSDPAIAAEVSVKYMLDRVKVSPTDSAVLPSE
jgi:hypothetical protein